MIFFGKKIPYVKHNWDIYIRTFKTPKLFNMIFSILDMQGDGFILMTIGFLYHSIQLEIPFPGDKIKTRIDWRLFKN